MPEPILLKLPPRDPREAVCQRLESAAQEHAEALLTTYDILQGLHDRRILELAKGVPFICPPFGSQSHGSLSLKVSFSTRIRHPECGG